MKILLSPAKALDYNRTIATKKHTFCAFMDEANQLVQQLQKIPKKELGKLMHLSENLTDLNYSRYQEWIAPKERGENVQPAISVFNGAAFKGFDAPTLNAKELDVAQEKLRILSGLYGILKPLDLISPYRLEMGTKWEIDKATKNLYAFWGSRLSEFLNEDMKEKEPVINLASKEYFKAIDKKILKGSIITPIFKELKGDKYKVVMMYAKTARGKMSRYIIQNNLQNSTDLKGYDVDGYSYNEQLSTDKEWVFVR